jgi:hypothetical protein
MDKRVWRTNIDAVTRMARSVLRITPENGFEDGTKQEVSHNSPHAYATQIVKSNF